jgi:hypothetical protein
MITICCVCKKTKKNNLWETRPIPNQTHISHGYCPQCFRKVLTDFKASFSPSLQLHRQQG